MLTPTLRPHDQVRFALAPGRWDVIDDALDGRYVLVVYDATDEYQVLDLEQGVRGALTATSPRPERGEPFEDADVAEGALFVLSELNDGRRLHPSSLSPLLVTEHRTSVVRGPVIDGRRLSFHAERQVMEWLRANGCRWFVPAGAVIRIRGHYVEVDTWPLRTRQQVWTLRPKRLPAGLEIPTKRRRFRIRVPLSTIRKA
jgi:hypothetical protein